MSKLICLKFLIAILIGLLLQLKNSNGASFEFQMKTIKEIESIRDKIVNKLSNTNEQVDSGDLKILNYKSASGRNQNRNQKFMSLNVVSSQAEALPAYQNPNSKPFTAVFIPNGYTMFKLDLPADFYGGEYFTVA
jgi:hypothetical protein